MSRNLIILGVVAVLLIGGMVLLLNNRPSSTANVTPTPIASPASASPSAALQSIRLSIGATKNSTQSGEMVLKEESGATTVTLTTQGAPTGVAQPAHIHVGMCPDVGAVKYPLTNLTNGTSTTTIDVSIEDLMNQLPLAVNIHKSTTEPNIYVSCGNISKDS